MARPRGLGALLARTVTAGGRVRYEDLDEESLHAARAAIATADLSGSDRDHRYAFLLNAYNGRALFLAYRLLWRRGTSLRNPWNWVRFFLLSPVRVAGRRMNLLALEFLWLKPYLRRDARGHFALVCASSGCPPLRDGIYHGDALDAELDQAAQAFLRPGHGYRIDRDHGVVWVTRILKWYRSDFRALGGTRAVLERYAGEEDRRWLRQARPRIRYMPYDWSWNRDA